jgi:hypothetical protein
MNKLAAKYLYLGEYQTIYKLFVRLQYFSIVVHPISLLSVSNTLPNPAPDEGKKTVNYQFLA